VTVRGVDVGRKVTSMIMRLEHPWSVPHGAPVVTVDDQRLGCLLGDGPRGLMVGHGMFLLRRYHIPLSDVARYEDGTLFLRVTLQQVLELDQLA